jgi:hypothetical protein
MSLNSLQDDMSRRAASMAAMAKRATNPQDIQAIQKSLVAGVQNGSIQPYVGIPLIQELTKKMAEAKTQMAQSMAGAGMQQPQGQQGAPIAQQVMAQAQQSQGVEALPSNLPQEYAGGGIIAFEEGGPVERFQVGGQPKYETPYDRMNRLNREAAEQAAAEREAQAREQGIMPYGQQMSNVGSFLGSIPMNALKTLVSAPGYGFNKDTPPTATPAAVNKDLGPVPGTTDKDVLGGRPTDGAGIAALPGVGRAPAAAPAGVASLGQKPLAMPTKPTYEKSLEQTARDEFAGLGARSDSRIDELIAAQSKNKMEGKAFEGLKKTLEEEAAQAGVEKADAKAMSIFKAGLAMMSGTSRNALENIGKGAMTGAEDYQRAAADLKKADKERQKQFAAIEEARRAEDRDDVKTRNAQLDKAYTAKQRQDELGINAIMAGTGKDRDTATELWKTEYSGAKTIEAAKIGAGATLGAAQIGADSRLQAAELKASLLGLGGGKGALTQDQLIKNRQTIAESPQIAEYKKQLVAQYGKNVVNQPGYQEALNKQIDQLLMQLSAQPGASMGFNMTPAQQSLVSKYLNPR